MISNFRTKTIYPENGETWPPGTHFVEVESLLEMRRLFGPANEELRRQRSRVFYEGLEARSRLPQGMHDRGQEYVLADGKIHAQDLAGHARHSPMHVKVIRLPFKQLHQGDVWDLSVRHDQWSGLGYMEELYVYVHIDHLLVDPGARVIVHGNVLIFECDLIEMQSGTNEPMPENAKSFEICILPTPFSLDRPSNSNTGAAGRSGENGAPGKHGLPMQKGGTLFGAYVQEESSNREDFAGGDGSNGQDGEAGKRGLNGGMCKLADIRIGSLIGFERNSLLVYSQAGTGSPGGNGGSGGHGGAGGHGAHGVETIKGVISGGSGGRGGNGGSGGNGGMGGNGGISSNIFIQIPIEHLESLSVSSRDSQGGAGGMGGQGGTGGSGGLHGDFSKAVLTSPSAQAGESGQRGDNGRNGKSRPGARIFVFSNSPG